MSFIILLVYVAVLFIRPGELYPELAPYHIIMTVGVIGLITSLGRALGPKRSRIPLVQLLLFLSFLAVIAFSRIASGWLGGAPDALYDFAPSAILFLMVIFSVDSPRKLTILAAVFVLAALVIVTQGIFAYHFGWNDARFVLHEVLDPPPGGGPPGELRRIRSLGLLNDPNDLAQVLVAVLPFIALAWRRSHKVRNLLFVYVPAGIALYGIFLTHSRGGAIALLALVGFALYPRVSKKTVIVCVSLLFVVVLALNVAGGRGFSADGSAEGRLDAWSDGLHMLRADPLFGVGYRFFSDERQGISDDSHTAHNSFVLCFAELGLIGYFCWLALLITTFLDLHRSIATAADVGAMRLARAFQISLAGFLVGGFFLSRTYTETLYMLVGGALAASRMADAPDVDRQEARKWVPRVVLVEFASIVFIYVVVRLMA